MSGGFFRGTSADQDTRFSNKAAKLLKSQKFPAELDQLVDMTKVKMDVIRPWIANRATEFLGFEDEVLINFIYGLLDGKEVDGKQIQIQLTGFMEKNTGKFMKELWSLLTSAQKNASGIPQQFLDAKAEETRKKKAETDRINYEVQKKKEQEEREAEQERQKKINADLETAKIAAAAAAASKPSSGKASLRPNPDDHVAGGGPSASSEGKNGDMKLSHGGDHSPLSRRSISSLSRSRSQSYSVSRSPSRSPRRRHRSQSTSRSPRRRRRSTSIVRHARSPIYSPPRHKRSPLYARSPPRRRSPSLQRRRSPSPPRRRSPSLQRRRSPSPPRRRSPSLQRRRSPSLQRHRSPSPPRRRSPVPRSPRPRNKWSPVRSPRRRPMDSQSPPRRRKSRSRSPHYRSRRSLSRDRNTRLDAQESRRYRDRYPQHRARGRSPNHLPFERDENEYERRQHVRAGGRSVPEPPSYHQRSSMTSRSPDRNLNMRAAGGCIVPESPRPQRSPPKPLRSPPNDPRMRQNEERRQPSPYQSQMGLIRERSNHHESSELRKKQEHGRDMENVDRRVDLSKRRDVQAAHESERKEYGPRRVDRDRDSPINRSGENHSRLERPEPRRKEYYTHGSLDPSERRDIRPLYASEAVEYGPGKLHHGPPSPDDLLTSRPGVNRLVVNSQFRNEYENEELAALSKRSFSGDSYESNERRHPAFKGSAEYDNVYKPGTVHKTTQKLGPGKQMVGSESDTDEKEAYRRKYAEKGKIVREEADEKIIGEDEDQSNSPRSGEERREAKRRRKEEKRIRKEERRRRREERHRRKEERRAGRHKAKAVATVTPPSGFERDDSAADESDDSHGGGDHSRKSCDEEMESEQQRLEIELRRKALESLRARKAISH